MKNFLKKLFYWDHPAEGAVFASVLFWLGGWCLATVFILFDGPVACSVLPRILQHWHMVEYPLAWQHLLPLAGFAVLIYYLIVTGHFYHTMIREKCRWGILIFSAIILVGTVTCVCLDLERTFFLFLYSMFCWVIPLCCLPKQWKWLIPAGFAPALIALPFIAFWDILESLLDTVGDPWLPSRVFASAAQLTVPSIVLGILCCLCGFKAYANAAGKPFRAMFGKGVTAVATVFLLIYGVSLGMAYSAHCQTERHVAEMERFFGRKVSAQGLKELYYRDRKPDAAFWRKATALYEKFLKGDFPDNPDAALAPADLSAWKKRMEGSRELRELETMFGAELPAVDRDFRRGNIAAISLPELQLLRQFVRCEAWRVRFAIAERNVPVALSAMKRMVKARNYLAHDPTLVLPSLVMIGLENIRLNALEQLLSSGLLTESQLIGQRDLLAGFRKQIPGIHARAVYGEAVMAMDLCDMFIYGRPADKKHDPSGQFDIPAFYDYRWLFPAAWYQFTRMRDIAAVNYQVSEFTRIPFKSFRDLMEQESTAHRVAGAFLMASAMSGNKFHSLTARYLAMETLIGIELKKRRTGKYPDKLENPPVDPFGEPLLYRKGKMPYIQYQRTAGTDQPYGKEKRITVDAVAVWSKGPNRKDDQGLSNWKENNKPTDDARTMIIFQKK